MKIVTKDGRESQVEILAITGDAIVSKEQRIQFVDIARVEKVTTTGPGYVVGATALNVIYIPGKVILCTLGGVAGLITLGITLGSGYPTAARIVNGGCGGLWVVTAQDLKGAVEDRMY